MSAITAKASRKMKKYAVLTREPRCFLGSFDFSWEQRKLSEITDKVTEKNAGLQYVETFTNSAEFGIISQRDFFDHDIAKLGSLDGYYIVKNEDFVYNPRISTSAPVGPINRNKLGRTGVMSPLYTVFRPHDIDTTYLEYFFKCGYWHSFMNFNGDSGARSDRFSIRDNVFFQMPIPIPDIDEQRKIGELLTCLDNLITLHQRKCANLCSPSQVVFSLLFATSTFSWEQRKAKELFVSTADKGYPELPVLSATQDRGMIRRDENSINIFHDKKNEAGYKRVLPGQFVIHLRSFQGGFAHSAIEGITSPAYTVFGFSEPEKHDSEYWKYVFTSKSFIQRLKTVTYGIRDGRSISYEEFLTLGFVYPSKAEQTAIARYLDKLSDLITLHQRECISFTGRADRLILTANKKRTTSSWEQRKAKEICSIGTGKSNTQDQVDDGKYPFYIRSDVPVRSNKYLYDCEAVITIGDGNIGKVFHYVNGKFDLHQRCYKMTDFKDIWGKYFFYYFSTKFYDRAMKMTAKATVDSVRLEMISEMDIKKPPQISEQKQIAEFFANLDNLITLHQRKPFLMKWRTSDANRNQTNRLVL